MHVYFHEFHYGPYKPLPLQTHLMNMSMKKAGNILLTLQIVYMSNSAITSTPKNLEWIYV